MKSGKQYLPQDLLCRHVGGGDFTNSICHPLNERPDFSLAMKDAIYYTISPHDPEGHLFRITLTVPRPDPDGQHLVLPAWIPGSYMIREFARHIVEIRAQSNGQAIALEKRDKHTWQVAPCDGAFTLEYDVYAWDLSVRTAHLDQTHGFFNGTSVFLRVVGQEHLPHIVEILPPADPALGNWRVATTLPELEAPRYHFGSYIASDYDELIDHPVEMGTFELAKFDVLGTPHEVAVTGRVLNFDMDRLISDLRRICEIQIRFFDPVTLKPPMERYLFMIMVVGSGYGGLEHRASTALMCSRADLPAKSGDPLANEGYISLLGLCSHEYFHSWLAKRIRPAAFVPLNLQSEVYTELLWVLEGFTSYYDDLMLVRSSTISVNTYLERIARTLNLVRRAGGRKKQSIAEASFDAWVKFYRPDENTTNAQVNYYTKGSLVALALDLLIRLATQGEKSLDDAMVLLWKRYGQGRDATADEKGFTGDCVKKLLEEVSGLDLGDFYRRFVHGTDELDIAPALEDFGITAADSNKGAASLNMRITRQGSDTVIANVYEGGAAHRAGLAAGDVLVAVNDIRIPAENATSALEQLLGRYVAGESVKVHVFRRDELMAFPATLAPDDEPRYALSLSASDNEVTKLARLSWLMQEDG